MMFPRIKRKIVGAVKFFSKKNILRRELLSFMLENISDFCDNDGTIKVQHGQVNFDASQFLTYNSFRSLMGSLIKEIVKPFNPDILGATGDRAKIIAMDACNAIDSGCKPVLFRKENFLIHEDDHEDEVAEGVVVDKKIVVVATYYNDFLLRSIIEAKRQGYTMVAAISLFGWESEYLRFKRDFAKDFSFITVFCMEDLMPVLLEKFRKTPKTSPF